MEKDYNVFEQIQLGICHFSLSGVKCEIISREGMIYVNPETPISGESIPKTLKALGWSLGPFGHWQHASNN